MKANELRINNWYKSVKFGVPVQCDLSDLMELYHKSDGAYDDPPIDEMFEPIPLTEEWIKRLGFKKETAWYRLGKHAINPLLANLYEFKNIPIIEVAYVHSLQNLYFSLTGNELELTK